MTGVDTVLNQVVDDFHRYSILSGLDEARVAEDCAVLLAAFLSNPRRLAEYKALPLGDARSAAAHAAAVLGHPTRVLPQILDVLQAESIARDANRHKRIGTVLGMSSGDLEELEVGVGEVLRGEIDRWLRERLPQADVEQMVGHDPDALVVRAWTTAVDLPGFDRIIARPGLAAAAYTCDRTQLWEALELERPTEYESIRQGLSALREPPQDVFGHSAARPAPTADTMDAIAGALEHAILRRLLRSRGECAILGLFAKGDGRAAQGQHDEGEVRALTVRAVHGGHREGNIRPIFIAWPALNEGLRRARIAALACLEHMVPAEEASTCRELLLEVDLSPPGRLRQFDGGSIAAAVACAIVGLALGEALGLEEPGDVAVTGCLDDSGRHLERVGALAPKMHAVAKWNRDAAHRASPIRLLLVPADQRDDAQEALDEALESDPGADAPGIAVVGIHTVCEAF